MGWVYKKDVAPRPHKCLILPMAPYSSTRPDAEVGSIWRCDDCGRLWIVGLEFPPPRRKKWRKAGWIVRFKVRYRMYEGMQESKMETRIGTIRGSVWRRRQ